MPIRRFLSRRLRRTERGAALMMIALSMTSVVAVTGVVVDGSGAFAQRRQMQNAADSAAMAGARALDQVATNAEASIWTAVTASAVSNGADASMVTCRLVTDLLVDLGACPTAGTGTAAALREAVSGVRVTVATTKSTTFIRIVGAEQFTARATATAQIQALRSGNSPFALCAVGDTDPRALGDGQLIPIILPDNSMNPLALGQLYELQDPTTIGCGQNTDFKGLTENLDASYPVPGPWNLANGDHGINAATSVVAGNLACRATLSIGCVIFVPLCHAADPPMADVLYCQRFGAFQIVDIHSSSRISGRLVDGVLATGGAGGGHPGRGEARVIKLSE